MVELYDKKRRFLFFHLLQFHKDIFSCVYKAFLIKMLQKNLVSLSFQTVFRQENRKQ
jgi:hypothetical protein